MLRSISLLVGTIVMGTLIACEPRPDTRLVEDQKTCSEMGHAPGTPIFKQCLAELNERRCRVERSRYGSAHHVDSRDCTRLPGQPSQGARAWRASVVYKHTRKM